MGKPGNWTSHCHNAHHWLSWNKKNHCQLTSINRQKALFFHKYISWGWINMVKPRIRWCDVCIFCHVFLCLACWINTRLHGISRSVSREKLDIQNYTDTCVYYHWLVVWTPLKNISQLGWLFPIYGKIKNVPNHQPDHILRHPMLRQANKTANILWILFLWIQVRYDMYHTIQSMGVSKYNEKLFGFIKFMLLVLLRFSMGLSKLSI